MARERKQPNPDKPCLPGSSPIVGGPAVRYTLMLNRGDLEKLRILTGREDTRGVQILVRKAITDFLDLWEDAPTEVILERCIGIYTQ